MAADFDFNRPLFLPTLDLDSGIQCLFDKTLRFAANLLPTFLCPHPFKALRFSHALKVARRCPSREDCRSPGAHKNLSPILSNLRSLPD